MSFEELPNELSVQILEYVPNVCSLQLVSKQFNNVISDIEQRVFKNPDKYIEQLSPSVYFLLKDNKYYKLIWNKAIIKGHLDLIIMLDELGYKFNVNISMKNAAFRGHKNLVEFFIGKGADDYNGAIGYAAKGGHKDLIEFFIEKGANDWNRGMTNAARRGHTDLVTFFIEKGANDWNWGLQNAIMGDYEELVDFFRGKGVRFEI